MLLEEADSSLEDPERTTHTNVKSVVNNIDNKNFDNEARNSILLFRTRDCFISTNTAKRRSLSSTLLFAGFANILE